jgi:hypothetical protein
MDLNRRNTERAAQRLRAGMIAGDEVALRPGLQPADGD